MKTKENIINKLQKNSGRNKRKYIFYKTNPCGISLIVLVITIIVIIILATAIMLTLNKNNPIAEANKARYENDRDSIQSVFTNTVAKIMAKNQGTMNIEARQLNEVKEGVNSTVGETTYTLNSPEKSENASGKIIFDNKENTEIEYYTGRKLPIYKAGETIWSVDSEGIINLKVGGKTVGDNENSENGNDDEDEKGENVTISKEEYDNIKDEIQNLKGEMENIKKQPKNIERVNLMDIPFDVPLTTSWTLKDYGEITLNDNIEKYKYVEFNMEIYGIDRIDGIDKQFKQYEKTEIISTNNLKYNNSNTPNWNNGSILHFDISRYSSVGYDIYLYFKNENSIKVCAAYTNDAHVDVKFRIKNIYGVN